MQTRWLGHSTFHLSGSHDVVIDPFGPPPQSMTARGNRFSYPAISGVRGDLTLITHDHFDHAAADQVAGDPDVIRSRTGRIETVVGELVAIASEHDEAAGTERGANSIYVFELDGHRVCHFGDFGQRSLRPEQRDAIGHVDLLFLPTGGRVTIGAEAAAEIARQIRPKIVVPMHYGNEHVNWLDPVDEFLAALRWDVVRLPSSERLDGMLVGDSSRIAVFATPE